MRPWSKLQKSIYQIIDPKAKFQIHCSVYLNGGVNHPTTQKYPRYWITINKDIIFDFSKMFLEKKSLTSWSPNLTISEVYPNDKSISDISNIIRSYLDTPKDQFLKKDFNDYWGITEIFKLVDKRVGKKSYQEMVKSNNFKLLINENFIDQSIIEKIYKNRWGN